jgi:hypothetical protein
VFLHGGEADRIQPAELAHGALTVERPGDDVASISGTIATLDPAVDGHLTDTDGTFTRWLQANNADGVLTRPDQYVFGSTSESRGAAALLDHLRSALR